MTSEAFLEEQPAKRTMKEKGKKSESIKDRYYGWLNPYSLAIFTAILLVIGALNQLDSKNDTDILWHYKLGEQILKTHQITLQNTFTWEVGSTWNQQEWLFDVIFYLIVHFFGLWGYVVMYAAGKLLGLFVCLFISRPRQPFLFFLFYLALQYLVRMSGRPGEYSVFLILLFVFLYDADLPEQERLLILALLGIFMANFHGGNICAMLCMYGVMLLVDFVLDLRAHSLQKKEYFPRFLGLLVFAAASCLCPMGPGVLVNSILAARSRTIPYIAEWQQFPMKFHSALLLVFGILSLGYFLKKSRFARKPTQHIALIAAFTVLTFLSNRNSVILGHLWLCFGSAETMQFVYDLFLAEDKTIWFPADRIRAKRAVPISLAIVTASLLFTGWEIQKYPSFASYGDRYCSEEILRILEASSEKDTRILAPYVLNNSLLFHDVPVSFDSREYPYDTRDNTILWEAFKTEAEDLSYSTEYVERYRFDYVWTDRNTYRIELSMEQNSHYEKICEDKKKEQMLWKRKPVETEREEN